MEQPIEIFISHSSKDAEIVRAFVNLLRSALRVPASAIRCTSLDGYLLPGGADFNEQLRREIRDAKTFVAILSPRSLQSMYVVIELGARWGFDKYLLPLLTPDITASEVTGPIAGRNALRLDSVPQLHQVVEELAHELGVEHESPAVYYDAITHVTQLSTPPASFPEPPSSAKSTAERGIAKVEILEPQSGTDASLITTVRGTVVPEDLPVQVFVLSGDNRWYPRPAENTNGRWQATCRIGSKEGRPGGEYKLVAVAGADPVTERVNELPRGIAVSEPVTVRRKPADAAPGENVSIQLAAVENGIAVTIVNHLPDRLRGPQLLIMDIRRLARGRDRYVETSEFHQSGRFPIFAIGHIPDIFHEEQRSVMFIDASDRQVLRIEARTTGQQPKEYRATLTNAGAWEARLQLKAGERTLERRLYFAWRPGEAPRVVGPYED